MLWNSARVYELRRLFAENKAKVRRPCRPAKQRSINHFRDWLAEAALPKRRAR
jgi:hypothetical protein